MKPIEFFSHIRKLRCPRCHKSWTPRIEFPMKCPYCQASFDWNDMGNDPLKSDENESFEVMDKVKK